MNLLHDLGSHPARRPDKGAGGLALDPGVDKRAGNTKVGDLDRARRVHEDVTGLAGFRISSRSCTKEIGSGKEDR